MMKNSYNVLVIIFSIIIVMGLASAEEYSINTPIEFNKPCVDSGNSYCPQSTQCFVSLKYLNGATILSNKSMTYIYPYANYTFPAQSELRDYVATVNCFNNGQNGTQDYQFKVNVSGDNRDNYSLLIILGIITVLVFAFGYFTHNVWFVYISGIMFLILGVYVLIYGFNSFRDVYTDVIGYVSIGFGIFFFVMGAYEQFIDDDNTEE